MRPKISIIVPVYNVEKYLDRCISSLINQSLRDIEIILVDDGSPDRCPQMCDNYAKIDPRLKVIHKKNEGLGKARNSGIKIAEGEYVTFVDSDDFLDLNAYEHIYNIAKEKKLDTCYFKLCRYYKNGKTEKTKDFSQEIFFLEKREIFQFLLEMVGPLPSYPYSEKYSMSVCKAIYSLDQIKKNEISFISEKEIASEDLIFHLDYLPFSNRVGYLPNNYYYYYVNTNSITTTYNQKKYERLIKLLELTEVKLKKYFLYKDYYLHYYAQVIRVFKVILRFESLSEISLNEKRKMINSKCCIPLLEKMYSEILISKYSLINRLYLFCMKNKISIFFILYYKIKETFKKML